ncbi:MAG TPA: CPBP family intramembrane glutamic endopeptidase [Candidatus Limnocylindrales bacterium]|nr:CPBP family intramembrane glutamic endopeptidase [Candidatus Limnocylindrales bacterium]
MVSALRSRPAVRAALVGGYVLAVEWFRALAAQVPVWTVVALLLGGTALAVATVGWSPAQLGLGTSRFWLRILGGLALGAVLLLPAAARGGTAPLLPAGLAAAAVAVSIGEELAFRGALYAALDEIGGPPLAVAGSTLLWTLGHAFSHPLEFLGAVAAAGLLLALWRWACKDLVGPIVGHVIADLAL